MAVQNLQPQESKNFELGTKWEVLNGRLSLNAAIFKSKMNNARVTAPDGTSQNVGRKELKGLELGFSGKLTNAWQVFGGYTYLDGVRRRQWLPERRHHGRAGVCRVAIQRQRFPDHAEAQRLALDLDTRSTRASAPAWA